MGKAETRVRFNYHDYLLLPEDKRYEIIDGELLIAPAPRPFHQIVSARIEDPLRHFVEERGLGIVIYAPCDVYLSLHNIVQPDILFIASDRLGIVEEKYIRGAPDLVVEVISPADPDRDRQLKRKLYSQYGVREYWAADPEAKTIEVLNRREATLVPFQTFAGDDRLASPLLEGFFLPLPGVFKPFR